MSYRAIIAAAFLLAPAAAVHAETPTLEQLAQRVQRMEDESAIRRIMVDYAARLGARDIDGYVALFAKDGIWQNGDIVKKGHDEIRGLLLGMYGEPDPNYVNNEMYMLVSNIQIDVEGDRATAKSRQLTIRRGEGGRPTPVLNGLYEDQFIREDGEWKILHRIDNVIMPSREEWAQFMAQRRAESEQKGN